MPAKKLSIKQPNSDPKMVEKKSEVSVAVKERVSSRKKLQAQVANPLDLSSEVVNKIDSLYRKPKEAKKTSSRKKRSKKS
jgi:hypothetical protein